MGLGVPVGPVGRSEPIIYCIMTSLRRGEVLPRPVLDAWMEWKLSIMLRYSRRYVIGFHRLWGIQINLSWPNGTEHDYTLAGFA